MVFRGIEADNGEMRETVLVSVITVCYNSEKTIRRTMESVWRQTYSNIEYIIVDGGSTDRTMEFVQEYKELFGERMKVICERDRGIYDAMNKGIRLSHGELVGIINSDDYYETDAVEKAVLSSNGEKYQVLYGMLRVLDHGRESMVYLYSHEFLQERMIGHPACFVSKAVYDRWGCYDLRYPSVADYDFMLRISAEKEVVFVPVYEILAVYATGGMSGTRRGYLDKLRLLRDRKMISVGKYWMESLKERVKMVLYYGKK